MRLFIVLSLGITLMLAGCVVPGFDNGLNKITTYDQAGNIIGIQEMSDDAVYYDRLAAGKTQVNCTGMSFEQCGLLIAIGGLVDVAKGYPARGMNGYELVSKISSDVVAAVPYGAIGFVAYEALKRPGTVNVAEGATYSDIETHLTGNDMNDGNSISIPNDSPPTTTTTTVQ
jgi:hypothetical protein